MEAAKIDPPKDGFAVANMLHSGCARSLLSGSYLSADSIAYAPVIMTC
jgi:hypothetical protein